MIQPTVRSLCLAVSLALLSLPWAEAAAASQQTLGALKPKNSRPKGYPCNVLGDISPSEDLPTPEYIAAKMAPDSDPTLCYLACLKTPSCKSVEVPLNPLDSCTLYSATLRKGSKLKFKANPNGSGRFTSVECLTSKQVPINPPNESCTHNPGDYFALRVSAPASDYRNGYWVTAPTQAAGFGITPAFAIGSTQKAVFYIEPSNNTLKLPPGDRFATYYQDLTNSVLSFAPLDSYDPDTRTAIPITCAITNGKLICADGDPAIPPTTTPKKFSFSLCVNMPSGGYPSVFQFPLPYIPGLGHGAVCNAADQRIDLIAYYACF